MALHPAARARQPVAPIAVLVLVYALLVSLGLAALRRPGGHAETDLVLVGLAIGNDVIFAPVAEEVLFRGWLYTWLRARFSFGFTIVATSSLFAAIHGEPRHVLLVLPLAFALGFVREQTGSIRPTILLHAAYNAIMVAVILLT